MTSAYSQYLRDSCKQHLALVGSQSDIWVYGENKKGGLVCPLLKIMAPTGSYSKILAHILVRDVPYMDQNSISASENARQRLVTSTNIRKPQGLNF